MLRVFGQCRVAAAGVVPRPRPVRCRHFWWWVSASTAFRKTTSGLTVQVRRAASTASRLGTRRGTARCRLGLSAALGNVVVRRVSDLSGAAGRAGGALGPGVPPRVPRRRTPSLRGPCPLAARLPCRRSVERRRRGLSLPVR